MSLLKSKLFRSLGIYTIANVINSAIPFLLLPVLTEYLKPEAYGSLTNFNSLIGLLIPFISLNLMTSLQVIFVKDKEGFPSYLSTGMLTIIALTLIGSACLWIFSSDLEKLLGVPRSIIILSGLYATYQNIVEVLLSVWRMEDKAVLFGVFRIARTIVELAIALVLIIGMGWSFDGSIMAMSWSYGIAALISLLLLYRSGFLKWEFHWKHVRHLVVYGAPLIPHVLGSVVIMYTDKLVITHYKGLGANGIYSVGFMVGQVIGLLQNSFNQAWVPYIFKGLQSGEEQVKSRIVHWTYIYFIGIVGISLLFYICTPLVFYFLGDDYRDGMSLVLWIALGFAFNGMYKMVSVYFFYTEKTIFIAVISTFTAIINVGFALFMVPRYGYTGAAIATMSAFFIQFILTWIWSSSVVKMPWQDWKIWKR